MLLDRLFPKNKKRRPDAARGNYAFRSRRKPRVRLDVHRLELNPETEASRRVRRGRAIRWGFQAGVGLLLAMGLFSAGRIVVREAFTHNQRFLLQHVSVNTDGELSPSQLIAATGLQENMNMLDISLVQVREKLEAMPQVRHAKVSRGYPGMVFLEVEQRRPVAWLECEEQRIEARVAGYGCLLDDRGVVLPSDEISESRRRLPIIEISKKQRLRPGHQVESAEALQALELLKAHERSPLALSMKIRRVVAKNGYSMEANYDTDFKAIFPVNGVEAQVRRLERVVNEAANRNWELAEINLLVDKNVPLKIHNPPVEAEPAPEAAPEPAPAPASRRTASRRQLARNN